MMCLAADRCMNVLVAADVVVACLDPSRMVAAQVVGIVRYHVSAAAVVATVATAESAAGFAGRSAVMIVVEAVAALVGVVVAAVEDPQGEDVLTDSGSHSVFAGAAAGSAEAETAAVRRSVFAAVAAGIGHY